MTPTETLEKTPAVASDSTDENRRTDVDRFLYLKGRPTLRTYIRFVKHHGVEWPGEGVLTDEWREAAEIVRGLQKTDAGAADDPPLEKIGKEYEPLLIEFLKDPLVQNGFETVPTEVALVELDRMIVWQRHIDLTFIEQLEKKFPPNPSEEEIFRSCLLHDRLEPPVKWDRVRGNRYIFLSPSNDLRYLGLMKLKPKNIKNYPPPGDLAAVLGIAVGFGSNFMNAVYAKKEKRLILNNGSHRAYTLRKLGFNKVPCIVQHVSSMEEMNVVGPGAVKDDPDRFLKKPRPSMLKDYFNPDLRRVMDVHRRLKQVIVKFSIDEGYIPAM